MQKALEQQKTISKDDYVKIKALAGYPGHFREPWSNFDDAEIDFVIQYKHLTDASVTMPVLMWQVLEDAWIKNPEDGQKTFDQLGSTDKELVWIEGTTRRFKDGYNWFGRAPEKAIGFLDKYMK